MIAVVLLFSKAPSLKKTPSCCNPHNQLTASSSDGVFFCCPRQVERIDFQDGIIQRLQAVYASAFIKPIGYRIVIYKILICYKLFNRH